MKTRSREQRQTVKKSLRSSADHQTKASPGGPQPTVDASTETLSHNISNYNNINNNNNNNNSNSWSLKVTRTGTATCGESASVISSPSTSQKSQSSNIQQGGSVIPASKTGPELLTGLVQCHSPSSAPGVIAALPHTQHPVEFGAVMSSVKVSPPPSQRGSPVHNTAASTSPLAHPAVSGVQHVPYPSCQDRDASPVQLTELVSYAAAPAIGCDKNHNTTYAVSPQSLHQCPASDHHGSVHTDHRLVFPESSSSLAGSAEFPMSYYYHDLMTVDCKKEEFASSGHFALVSGIYPKDGGFLSLNKDSSGYLTLTKDSLYLPNNAVDDRACRSFGFCGADAGGREFSSPTEVPAFTTSTGSVSSAGYTSSSLNSSVTSSGSPDSAHQWAAADNGGHVMSPALTCLPPAMISGHHTPPPSHADPSSRKPQPSMVHAADYYHSSQHSGADEDSMQDIRQDILASDIHKHIFENFAHHLPMPPMDDEEDMSDEHEHEHAEFEENLTPNRRVGGGSKAGGGSSGKKRRRRTQTPVQRKAANLRERKRMCYLNRAFNGLKDRLPNVRNRKKLSRIQTLKAAIFYIGLLSECVQTS